MTDHETTTAALDDRSLERQRDAQDLPDRPTLAADRVTPEAVQRLLGTPKALDAIVRVAREQTFSGPIPPPKLLGNYDDVLKDGAERVFALAERESHHRHKIDETILEHDRERVRRGQRFALTVALSGLVATIVLSAMGQQIAASVTVATAMGSLAAAFLGQFRSDQKASKENAAPSPSSSSPAD